MTPEELAALGLDLAGINTPTTTTRTKTGRGSTGAPPELSGHVLTRDGAGRGELVPATEDPVGWLLAKAREVTEVAVENWPLILGSAAVGAAGVILIRKLT